MKSCPYCNAVIEVSSADAIMCPRCGEHLPRTGEQASETNPLETLDAPIALPRKRRSLLGSFAVVIVFALVIAMIIPLFRSSSSRSKSDSSATSRNRSIIPPAELISLRYLPKQVEVVAAWQNRGARSVIDEWVSSLFPGSEPGAGISFDQIDEICVGYRFEPIGGYLIVRLNAPVDWETLTHKQAGQTIQRNGRKYLQLPQGRSWVQPLLWQPDEMTIVLATTEADLNDFPSHPQADTSHLPTNLRAFLKETVAPTSRLWLYSAREDWGSVAELLEWVPEARKNQLPTLLRELKTVACWADLGPTPVFHLEVEMRNELLLAALFDSLRESVADPSSFRMSTEGLTGKAEWSPDLPAIWERFQARLKK